MDHSESTSSPWTEARLSDREFARLSAFIERNVGIRMPPAKRIMLESRLRKRLRDLRIPSFTEYCDYALGTRADGELVHLVDAVTTNKTDFFREPQHFEFLVKSALPTLLRDEGSGIRKELMVWSAGCSSGEEPYTLAMVLAEVAERLPGFRYFILGTDVCTRVLETARNATYGEDRIEPVPRELRKKYLLRSRDRRKALVRVAPDLRARVRFRRLNFLEQDFGMREPIDVIFCRNVFIYFDRPTQETVLNRFCRNLIPGGYVFLGHSETINGLRVPLVQVAPTVYRTIP